MKFNKPWLEKVNFNDLDIVLFASKDYDPTTDKEPFKPGDFFGDE